jgi:hypothetical protein
LPDTPHLIFTLLTFNDTAENIAVANIDADAPIKMPVIVTSSLGKGKIIALGSTAYLRKDLLRDTGVYQLAQNILTWSGNGRKHPKMGIYMAADSTFLALAHLQHISTYPVKNEGIEEHTDIIYLETDVAGKDTLKALETFVCNGGTLIQVSPYEQLYQKYWLRPYDSFMDGITDGYVVQPMVDLLFENNDINSAVLQGLKAQYKVPDTLAIPTQQKPITFSTAEDKARYHLTQRFQEKLHPTAGNKNAIAPGARYFPGAVPDTATSVATSITVPVQVGAQGLLEPTAVYFRPHSTGL